MAQDNAAAKAAAEEQAKTDAAAKAAASKIVCLVQEVVIEGVPRPRGTEYPADSDVVKRCLAPYNLVMPKPLFDKVEAAEKAKAAATAAAAAESEG